MTHDDTYLIHMNGRVYDYRLGRFLSVDPIISNPANSQSINPYSYIGNNPLSGTDPTAITPVPAAAK
jgi:RHS repeat-associated protein